MSRRRNKASDPPKPPPEMKSVDKIEADPNELDNLQLKVEEGEKNYVTLLDLYNQRSQATKDSSKGKSTKLMSFLIKTQYSRSKRVKEEECEGENDTKLSVKSDFCSGNGAMTSITREKGVYEIEILTRCDNYGTRYACKGSRNWYYFAINGAEKNDQLVIIIKNTKGLKLYRQGFKPVCRVGNNGKWTKVKKFRTFRNSKRQYIQEITYDVTKSNSSIYFAYTYPFSYHDLEKKINHLHEKFNDHPTIYFHVDNLIKSLQGRNLYSLTISSKNGISDERESNLPEPCHPSENGRPHRFPTKDLYLLTSRIHPGEVPASHIANGFIDYILGESPAAKQLRDRYVFKIIPMLNPDGVGEGSWRYHSLGFELNGCFWNPESDEEPVIFGAKEMMKYLYSEERLTFYMDLHAHVNTKNAFIFGNALPNFEDQLSCCLYPRLVSEISSVVDFTRCNFSYKRMENFTGTGRVAFYTQSSMVHCYTLEVNFHSGDRPKNTVYNKSHYRDVGKSLALGLLYFDGIGEKRNTKRERAITALRREMGMKIRLWRGSNKLPVEYAYGKTVEKLRKENRNWSKDMIVRVLCKFGGEITLTRRELSKK